MLINLQICSCASVRAGASVSAAKCVERTSPSQNAARCAMDIAQALKNSDAKAVSQTETCASAEVFSSLMSVRFSQSAKRALSCVRLSASAAKGVASCSGSSSFGIAAKT